MPCFAAPPSVDGQPEADRNASAAASGNAFLVAYRAVMLACAGLALAATTIRADTHPSSAGRDAAPGRERPA
jgi:hypothetical protein